MLWVFLISIFALVVAASNVTELPDQRANTGNVLPPNKCQMKRMSDVFYSPRASHGHGKIIRSLNSSNESECWASCCETHGCTLYMYSPVLLHIKNNVSCLLISCGNKSVCVTKSVPKNATGLSFVGIRQDDITNTSMVESSVRNFKNKQIKTHSHIANSIFSRRPASINATIHSISLIKGTTAPNSTMPQLTSHNGTNRTGLSPHTKHSHSITSLNQTQSSLLKSSVNSTAKIAQLLNGSYHRSKLDRPINYTKSNSSTSISHHMFSSLDRNLSGINVKSRNLSAPFSNVHNMSLSASHSPSSSSSFINITSGITSLRTHTMSSIGSLSRTDSSKFSSNSSSKPQDSKSVHRSSNTSQNANKKFSEHRSHTTPISLIISMIIGIVFFGTLVFLIGRRWGETCFRRGYSRVDYLLNDYD